jgi:glutaconate CoA-transferase subunit B
MLATFLAKATHAPNLLYFTILGTVNPQPHKLPYSTGNPHLFDRCTNAITFPEIFDLANRGRMDVAFLGGVQIDKYGSLNMSIIGNKFSHPKVRLPGGAGGPLMIRSFKRIVSWRSRHSQRCLVDQLPFTTSPGWIPRLAGRRLGGPDVIVTDLCVLKYNRADNRFHLESIHPGIGIDTVKSQTGFTVQIPKQVATTPEPSRKELKALRSTIDPRNIRDNLIMPPKASPL